MDRRTRLARERKARKQQAQRKVAAAAAAEAAAAEAEAMGELVDGSDPSMKASLEEMKEERELNREMVRQKRREAEEAEAKANAVEKPQKFRGVAAAPDSNLEAFSSPEGLPDGAAPQDAGQSGLAQTPGAAGRPSQPQLGAQSPDAAAQSPAATEDGLTSAEKEQEERKEQRKRAQQSQLATLGPVPENFFARLIYWCRAKRQEVRSYFTHYGPPYEEDYGGNLVQEIARDMNVGWYDVHSMLNEGADPRIPDDEDYDNTALHYACRFCRLDIVKMLFKAGAEVDQQNELGVTPLQMACMFNQVEYIRKKHTMLLELLIDKGANVNHLDRGGHTALEHASFYGNMDAVTLLLSRGAKVVRPTKHLQMKTPSPLDVVWNDEVKHIISLRAEIDTKDLAEKEAAWRRKIREKEEREAWERKNAERKLRRLEQMKENRRVRQDEIRRRAMKETEQRRKEIEKSEKRNKALLDQATAPVGLWERHGKMHWEFHAASKRLPDLRARHVLKDARDLDRDIKKANGRMSKDLKLRWMAKTGRKVEKPGTEEAFHKLPSAEARNILRKTHPELRGAKPPRKTGGDRKGRSRDHVPRGGSSSKIAPSSSAEVQNPVAADDPRCE